MSSIICEIITELKYEWVLPLARLLWKCFIWSSLSLNFFFLCLFILMKFLFYILEGFILICIFKYPLRIMRPDLYWDFWKTTRPWLLISKGIGPWLLYLRVIFENIVFLFLVGCLICFKIAMGGIGDMLFMVPLILFVTFYFAK